MSDMNPKADVLIITVTKVESQAVMEAFETATGQPPQPVHIDQRIYHDLGEVNGNRVFMAISEMGAGGPGGSQQTVQKGIEALKPLVVIMVGIAFGIDDQNQKIGDILVSKQLWLYELQRISKDKIISRGDKPSSSPRLINYMRGLDLYWEESKVHFGLVLSGEKLIDDINYRNQLKQFELEAIGGEMEGGGLYVACQDARVDWILVKAICDWADGNKDQDRDERQKLAAQNAARFVVYVLGKASIKDNQTSIIIDSTHYINEKLDGFVGRKFVFDAIKKFVDDNPYGYFFVRGKPGVGKSSIAAKLIRDNGYVHHFNRRTIGIVTAQDFLRNVCAQLITHYQLPYKQLPPGSTENSSFLEAILHTISKQFTSKQKTDEKCVIVIDALDEAVKPASHNDANLLYLPDTLPQHIYIVVTMRHDTLMNLKIFCDQDTLTMEEYPEANDNDTRLYINLQLYRPGIQAYIANQGIDNDKFSNLLVDKSKGNFMYLRYVLKDIEKGKYNDLNLYELPSTLESYYKDHWNRMKQTNLEAWRDYKLPVLAALIHAPEPISIDRISEFSGVKRKSQIQEVLEEWGQFLAWDQVIYSEEVRTRYSIYHASFHDFIAKQPQIKAEVEYLQPKKRIVENIWEEISGDQES